MITHFVLLREEQMKDFNRRKNDHFLVGFISGEGIIKINLLVYLYNFTFQHIREGYFN